MLKFSVLCSRSMYIYLASTVGLGQIFLFFLFFFSEKGIRIRWETSDQAPDPRVTGIFVSSPFGG